MGYAFYYVGISVEEPREKLLLARIGLPRQHLLIYLYRELQHYIRPIIATVVPIISHLKVCRQSNESTITVLLHTVLC
jgi:hypothetical protein